MLALYPGRPQRGKQPPSKYLFGWLREPNMGARLTMLRAPVAARGRCDSVVRLALICGGLGDAGERNGNENGGPIVIDGGQIEAR